MPRRRGKPRIAASTPRERVVLDPGEHCPDCGGALCLVGEAVAEILDLAARALRPRGFRITPMLPPRHGRIPMHRGGAGASLLLPDPLLPWKKHLNV